jgi:hypothetical protein
VPFDQPINTTASSSTTYRPSAYLVPIVAQMDVGSGSLSRNRAVSIAWTPMSTNAPPPASSGTVNHPVGPQPACTP